MSGNPEISRIGSSQPPADISRINPSLSERQGSPVFVPSDAVKAGRANEQGIAFLFMSNPFAPSTQSSTDGRGANLQSGSLSPHAERLDNADDWNLRGAASTDQLRPQPDGSLMLSPAKTADPQRPEVLSHRIEQNLPEGQGLDVHLKFRSSQSAPVTVEMVQSKEPYAQAYNPGSKTCAG
jgi:hypothetical protein